MAIERNSSDPALVGIVSLLAAERAERDPKAVPATEVLLARAGMSYDLIAAIVDKTPGAVQKAVSRAGKPGEKAKK